MLVRARWTSWSNSFWNPSSATRAAASAVTLTGIAVVVVMLGSLPGRPSGPIIRVVLVSSKCKVPDPFQGGRGHARDGYRADAQSEVTPLRIRSKAGVNA